MNSKLIPTSMLLAIALSLVVILQVQVAESKPIDLIDELMSDKFLMRMFGYLMMDGTERKGGSGLSGVGDGCTLPARKGNCRALLVRYRYDPSAKDCVEFNFGGCGGNANNYVTHKECMSACKES